jgi:predicted permease
MRTILTSLEAIAGLLGLGVVGFYIIAKNIVSRDLLRLLSSLAIEVALPLFVFTNLVTKFDPAISPGWWRMPIWWILFSVLMFILSVLFGRLFPKSVRRETALTLFIHNPTFVPLAIIIGMYGSDSPYLGSLFLFTMFTASFFFNIYGVFYKKSRVLLGVEDAPEQDSGTQAGKTGLDFKKLFNPVIKATALALFIKLSGLGVYVPGVILSVTKQIGDMTFPLVMIILGGNICLDMKNSGKIYVAQLIKFVAVKNFAFPLIMLAFLYFLRPPFEIALILLLEAASPPLSTVPVLIGRKSGNTEIANQYLVASFLLSVVFIPLMLSLLDRIYP